jgi:hypothetical protein
MTWPGVWESRPSSPNSLAENEVLLTSSDTRLARIAHLHELTTKLWKEIMAQRDAQGLLLPLERRQYLDGLQSGMTELDAARVVLAGVAGRLEEVRRPPLNVGMP